MIPTPLSGHLAALLLGMGIAATPGPVGALCLERAMTRGRASAFASGLGAAAADGLFALLAGSGLGGLLAATGGHAGVRLAGGLLLVGMGIRAWRTPPSAKAPSAPTAGLGTDFAGVFAFTLANPMTIASFAVAYAALGLAPAEGDLGGAVSFAGGVFVGSALWWLALAGMGSVLRARLGEAWRRGIARASGGLVVALGAVAVVRAVVAIG